MWLFEIKIEKFREDEVIEESEFVTAANMAEVMDYIDREYKEKYSDLVMVKRHVPVVKRL